MRLFVTVALLTASACSSEDLLEGLPDASIEVPPRIIYLNREGGTYTPGNVDNSIQNRTTLTMAEIEAPPWPHDDTVWDQNVNCVREQFAAFNVVVVDEDPGAVDHLEIVYTDTASLLGSAGSPFSLVSFSCEVIERGIGFVFAGQTGPFWGTTCAVGAAAAGTLYGLEWTRNCNELMTQVVWCSKPRFRDEDSVCGIGEDTPCVCGGAETVNTYRTLLGRLGPS